MDKMHSLLRRQLKKIFGSAEKIAELYGGKIWLTSTVGQGSTFFFTLPKTDSQTKTY